MTQFSHIFQKWDRKIIWKHGGYYRMVLRKNKLWSGPKMVLLVTTRQSLGLHQNMGRACSVSGCFGSPVIQGVPSVGATVPEDWLDASPIHMEVRQFPRNLGGQEARLVRMMITTLWGYGWRWWHVVAGKMDIWVLTPKCDLAWFQASKTWWNVFCGWYSSSDCGPRALALLYSFKFRVWMTFTFILSLIA